MSVHKVYILDRDAGEYQHLSEVGVYLFSMNDKTMKFHTLES